jgi:hypothetical protein
MRGNRPLWKIISGTGEKILVVDDEARRRDPYIKLLFDIAAQT